MFDLPKSTVVNRLIPKEKLIKKLHFSPAMKESLKNDVRKIFVTNELSSKSMNILRGEGVHAVFAMEIQLKHKDIDSKLAEALGKQIKQKLVLVFLQGDEAQLAVFYNKLYRTEWMKYDKLRLSFSGNDLRELWDSIVRQIAIDKAESVSCDTAGTPSKAEVPVAMEIARQERRKKLEREVAALDKKMRNERQPRRKLELAGKLKALKKELEAL